MRLVLAIVSFVLAAVMLSFGILQRTAFAPPSSVEHAVTTTGAAPLTVVDGAALNALSASTPGMIDGAESLTIGGSTTVVAAYGRTSDVMAWVGNASYNAVGVDDTTGALVSTPHEGVEQTVPSPLGSDLWLDDAQQAGTLKTSLSLSDDESLLLSSDGTGPAPDSITVSIRLDDSTPWSGPLIVGGSILLVIGLIVLLVAIYRMRGGGHGPRRRMPKVPKRKYMVRARRATQRAGGGGRGDRPPARRRSDRRGARRGPRRRDADAADHGDARDDPGGDRAADRPDRRPRRGDDRRGRRRARHREGLDAVDRSGARAQDDRLHARGQGCEFRRSLARDPARWGGRTRAPAAGPDRRRRLAAHGVRRHQALHDRGARSWRRARRRPRPRPRRRGPRSRPRRRP